MVKNFALVYGVICAASFHFASCQFDDYNINDLDEYQIYEGGYDAIEDASIDKTYFDPYAGEYDDPYSDSVFDDMLEVKDCQIAADGTATFNGTQPCDIQIKGVDKAAPNLQGGMDGVYKVLTCENGRPLYKRDTKDKQAERVLWYSAPHQDWDITNGSIAREEDILMWGGLAGRETRPQQVQKAWHLAAEFMLNFNLSTSPEYAEVNVTVACVDGTKEEQQQLAPVKQKWKPLLTDEEQDAQYRAVIAQGRANLEVHGGINSGLVVMFVGAGLGIVVGLPFMIARKKGSRKGPGDQGISLATFTEFFGGKQAHSS